MLSVRIIPAGRAGDGGGCTPPPPMPGRDGRCHPEPWELEDEPLGLSSLSYPPKTALGSAVLGAAWKDLMGFPVEKMGSTCERQHPSGLRLIWVSERVEGRKRKCAEGRKILPKWPGSFKGQIPRGGGGNISSLPALSPGIPVGALWKSRAASKVSPKFSLPGRLGGGTLIVGAMVLAISR